MADSTEVLMPLMGEGVNEATIIKWLKLPGEKVEKDEPLLEVSTDKVDTEIPAPSNGFLIACFADVGDKIEVYQTIAQISKSADATIISPSATTNNPTKPNAEMAIRAEQATSSNARAHDSGRGQPVGDGITTQTNNFIHGSSHMSALQSPIMGTYAGSIRSSPLVRKMARENGIDLADLRGVTGTGLYGRITKQDLIGFITHGSSRIPTSTISAKQQQASSFDPKGELFTLKTKQSENGQETLDGVPVRREKMSKIRWLTADHMLKSIRTSPHVTTTFEMNLQRIVDHRKANKEAYASEGANLTFTAYFIEAAIYALKKFPEVNASIDRDEILYKDDINIGCAVAIDSGLIVPVIKRANSFSLKDCAIHLSDIALRARNKKLNPDDIKGGTFSITNPGMYGSLHSQPIINQPQVAIMSVGAIVQRPVVIDNEICIRPLCQIGLTFDHRIVDGEGGAKFLATMQEFLETYSADGNANA